MNKVEQESTRIPRMSEVTERFAYSVRPDDDPDYCELVIENGEIELCIFKRILKSDLVLEITFHEELENVLDIDFDPPLGRDRWESIFMQLDASEYFKIYDDIPHCVRQDWVDFERWLLGESRFDREMPLGLLITTW